MGCVSSRRDINDIHPNIFQVMNVDELLQHVSPGQLEVTESEIVLYQRGNAATRWPLRSLRRYGFDEEIFTFESGRRCPTGPGIYAFRCRRAEQLFNLLQQNIQLRNLGDDLVSVANELSIPVASTGPPVLSRQPFDQQQTYLNSVNTISSSSRAVLARSQNQNNRFSRPGSVTSNGPASPPSAASPVPLVGESAPVSEHNNNKRIQHSYSNTLPLLEGDSEASSTVQPYMNLEPTSPTLSSKSEPYAQLNLDSKTESCHVYMNVTPGQVGEQSNPTQTSTLTSTIQPKVKEEPQPITVDPEEEKEDPKHCYANLNPGEQPETYQITNVLQEQKSHSNIIVPTSQTTTINTQTPTTQAAAAATAAMMMEARKVNYIVLDLESKKDLKQTPCTSLHNTTTDYTKRIAKGYATIDFNKTVALSHSVNPCLDLDNEGSRKTRHNSTIGDIAPILARHSTSLSD